ncbi:uncharacterized protein C8Q71DRAFT_202358 [Rhodofomes roseus]|uniref:C2 domain-containing protein n=1 Tax=Rhodofomes roseus TaxID=34475 RepID=A0ABQ8KV50_9APHY|nr:uncharacterized protein C8Q71DRAFT_202358 [Rhodofomes roseus]KAH9842409.1 hypothetical protein C8Q71DRAFT_202358 [Rhodofomes roseus]
MPGRKNPLQISRITEQIQTAITAISSKTEAPSDPLALAITQSRLENRPIEMSFNDLVIQFQGASGLPKMDVVGSADPYFVAKLDGKLQYISSVKENTLSPAWNEAWRIKNVPQGAVLAVEVMDKDSNSLTDGYVGQFRLEVSSGEKELRIEDRVLKRNRGTFQLKMDVVPSTDAAACDHPYHFDGPVRYSLHYSPTVGRLTRADSRLYATWKIYIKGIRLFFGDEVQGWNRDYSKARSIFQGPTSLAVRSVIHTGHRMLYARSAANTFGVLEAPSDILHLLHGHAAPGTDGASDRNPFAHRIKPALYTYVISVDDDSMRFSETGARFLVNMASKHALHSNCAQAVRFSGEFHPRPEGGWDKFSDDMSDEDVRWELVIDNKSGTYSPNNELFPKLKQLMEYNFPTFTVIPLDYRDPELARSSEACLAYATSKRGVSPEDLEPHVPPSEKESLIQRASNHLHIHRISSKAPEDAEPDSELEGPACTYEHTE